MSLQFSHAVNVGTDRCPAGRRAHRVEEPSLVPDGKHFLEDEEKELLKGGNV